ALEASLDLTSRVRIRGDLGADHLQGHCNAKGIVPGLIDRPHAPHTQQSDDVIAVAELSAWLQRPAHPGGHAADTRPRPRTWPCARLVWPRGGRWRTARQGYAFAHGAEAGHRHGLRRWRQERGPIRGKRRAI